MDETLRDCIEAIIEIVADGSILYWVNEDEQRKGARSLNVDAVVNDILAAVVEHDGEEALEAFGGG